ncbi:MAG: lipid-A-disaccharide synthase [Pyrinomonadaceae bacterium]
MVVAGEASGDAHAAKIVNEIKKLEPLTRFGFFGAAGPKMRKAGVEAVVRSEGLSIVGLAEVAVSAPMFVETWKRLKREAVSRKPNVVVLVDFPDFNLKLARTLKRLGFKTIYYISPQLWAWRPYRITTIKKYVDQMITILPFEKEWYAAHDYPHVEYIGHPLAGEVAPRSSKSDFCNRHHLNSEQPIVSFLPGSRQKEISRILPKMLDSMSRITWVEPLSQYLIALASDEHRVEAEKIIAARESKDHSFGNPITIVVDETFDAIHASDAAAVTSGTATLETGIIGTPMAIVYKTSSINYALFRPLISVEHYGLINLIAGKRVAKELIQTEFTAEALADELVRLLQPKVNRAVRQDLRTASEKLGLGGASARAAKIILETVRNT